MKATNLLWDEPGLAGAWAKLTHALIFDPLRRDTKSENRRTLPVGIFERIDRWFWRQHMRDREAYLAGSQDIFELEERIRRLERGSRYY
jgi:hypothetical protein